MTFEKMIIKENAECDGNGKRCVKLVPSGKPVWISQEPKGLVYYACSVACMREVVQKEEVLAA